jgi:DNA-binding NarL/FixJ family response regulator
METTPKSEQSILLVEDYEMDRTAVHALLQEAGYDPSQIHTATNTMEAQDFIDTSPPDILILDLEIPVDANTPLHNQDEDIRRGLRFLRTLTDREIEGLNIIVLSRFPKPWSVFQVLACGVSFIDKSNYKDLLIPAVEQAQHGHVIISSNVRPSLRQIFSLALRVGLEPEDVKIIRCLQESLRDRDIADKLGYSEEGVSGRLRKMFKSYGMHSRDELANWFRDFVDPILRFDQ